MKKNKKNEAKASKVNNLSTSANAEVLNSTEQATAQVTNSEEAKASKKAKKAKKEEATPKAKVVKEVAKQQKAALVEKVIANREVKYIYPEDVTDTLSRKTWRQKTRNKLHQLELAVSRIKDQNSKEYKKALKEYEDFKNSVLKPAQVA